MRSGDGGYSVTMADLFSRPEPDRDRSHEARQIRSRQAALGAAIDRAGLEPSHGTARRLVQIYDGGMIPSAPDHFYLSHPVELDGAETEGGTGTPVADSSQTIVVDVLRGKAVAGQILTAYAVGGRWVAEIGGMSSVGSAPCMPCAIPLEDLTLSWTNLISGPGLATMTYTRLPNVWRTGCIDGQIYELLCSDGQIDFAVTYFISGFCPTGQSQFCSNLRVYPFGLVLSSYTCSPFSVTFTVAPGCPEVESPGYTSFTITAGSTAISKPPPIVRVLSARRQTAARSPRDSDVTVRPLPGPRWRRLPRPGEPDLVPAHGPGRRALSAGLRPDPGRRRRSGRERCRPA